MIKLENITHKINNQTILNDISLKIEKGDTFGILGASGAGKTTLLKLLSLRSFPTSGNLYLFNNLIDKSNLSLNKKYLNDFGYVFQEFSLLNNLTVIDNISLPLKLRKIDKRSRHQKALELLELTQMKDLKDKYPNTLSGGEAQRVSILRALINNPKILLCDEPTSQLDDETTLEVLNLIKMASNKYNLTTIIISHDIRVIKYLCNKALILEKGKVSKYGKVNPDLNSFNENDLNWSSNNV
ncbi:MAG: ATP-binding cassette domain-containing protein [Acholeplasmataceae bacterium]